MDCIKLETCLNCDIFCCSNTFILFHQGAAGQDGTPGQRGLDGPPVGNLFFSYSRNKAVLLQIINVHK